MNFAQKIELDLTERQKQEVLRNCKYSKIIFNKGLEFWKDKWDKFKNGLSDEKPNVFNITKAVRKFVSETDFDHTYSAQIIETTIKDLARGVDHIIKKTHKDARFPKFKSLSHYKNTVRFFRKKDISIRIRDDGWSVQLPTISTIYGYFKLKEKIRFDLTTCTIQEVTISTREGRFFASFSFKSEINPFFKISNRNQKICGVDLGLKHLAVIADSDGNIFDDSTQNDFIIKKLEKKADHYRTLLSHKRESKDSENYRKTRIKLQRVLGKLSRMRKERIHKITTFLTKHYKTIVIENLDSSNLLKNHHLAKSVKESMFYEFRRQLEYKCQYHGNTLIIADKWFPSTQICSNCGNRKEGEEKLKLKQNTYRCKKCGYHENRDINAARNLMKYGQEFLRAK